MAIASLLGSVTWTTAAGTKTVTATPAVGDQIFLVTAHSGFTTTTTAPTDNNPDGLGAYTLVASALKNASADLIQIWRRNSLIGNASSTIFTHAPASTTGGGVAVIKVTGIPTAGAGVVIRSGTAANQASGTTPTVTLSAAASASSVMIGAVFSTTNGASATQRTGYTEQFDAGYNTPTSGLEIITLNSGETGSSIAWGSTVPSAYGAIVVEINAPAVGAAAGTASASGVGKSVAVAVGSASGSGTATAAPVGPATFDPVASSSDWSLSLDLLTATRTSTALGFWQFAVSTTSQNGPASAFWTVGALDATAFPMQVGAGAPGDTTPGNTATGLGTYYWSDGTIRTFIGPMGGMTAPAYGVGDEVGYTLDGVGGITFFKNGVSVASGSLGVTGPFLAVLSNGNGTGSSATADLSAWGSAGSPASVGSSSGTGSAAGVGQSIATATGSASGTGSASAVGTGVVPGVGAASGTGSATGAGTAAIVAAGSASGTGTASATGASLGKGTGSSAGTGSGSATGQSQALTAGAAAGTGAANGGGRSTALGVGSSAGIGAATGTGAALATGVGSAVSTGTATGASSSPGAPSVGSAAGNGAAAAVGASLALAAGSANGTSSASATGTGLGLASGTSAGTANTSAVGSALATGQGASQAVGSATAAGKSTASVIGSATVSSVANANGTGVATAVGSSNGVSTALGIGKAFVTGVGLSAGFGVVVGAGQSIAEAVGIAEGQSSAVAVGRVGSIKAFGPIFKLGREVLPFQPGDREDWTNRF